MDYVYRKYAEKMQKGTVNRNKNCPSAKDLERFIYSEMVKRKQRLVETNYHQLSKEASRHARRHELQAASQPSKEIFASHRAVSQD